MDVPRLLAERRNMLVDKYRRERDLAGKGDEKEKENERSVQHLPAKQFTKPILYNALKPAKKRKRPIGKNIPTTDNELHSQLFVSSLECHDGPISQQTEIVTGSERSASPSVRSEGAGSGPAYDFGPAPKPGRKRVKMLYKTQATIESRTNGIGSQWYASISTRKEPSRGNVITLGYLKNLIQNCITAARNDQDPDTSISNLRLRLHEMEFYFWLSEDLGPAVIKKSGVLDKGGLMTIFDDAHHVFPWDVKADALALYLRWIEGDIDGHLLRGIDTTKGTLTSGMNRTSHRIEKDYPKKRSANVSGSNDLVNGRWWPNRICALRDGAHGEQEAGIHGQAGQGAYSVVVAAGGYSDEDNGLAIEYCGTASKTPTPTKNTALLLETLRLQTPVRVLRAENRSSKYAPRRGVRYDGLYDVVGKELLDENSAMYRFSLRRQKNQDPIRFEGVEARPTNQELDQMSKIRERLGMTAI